MLCSTPCFGKGGDNRNNGRELGHRLTACFLFFTVVVIYGSDFKSWAFCLIYSLNVIAITMELLLNSKLLGLPSPDMGFYSNLDKKIATR